jgi:hypothetical protein
MNRLVVCLSMVSVALLSACGSEPDPDAAASAQTPKSAAPAARPAADDPSAKMARAVGTGKPGAAVDIRYEFRGKPSAGTPTELEIVFIPSAGVDSLDATVSGMEGVTVAGQLTASFANVEAGKPYGHTVSVLPDHTGVFYITVVANTQISGSSLGRTFSVPFVVGNAPAQQKTAPQKEASGQAIQPMKAQETTR